MPRFLIFTFVLSINVISYAQRYSYTAYVYDAKTREALEYVNVWIPSLNTGTITDKNGKFVLFTSQTVDSMRLSCIGYESTYKKIYTYEKNQKFYMEPKATELTEARIVAKENPAHRIMRLVFEHKKDNNPYFLPSYQVKQYSKTFFSSEAVMDSLTNKNFLDSLDSNQMEAYEVLQTQHFFLRESVIELNYKYPGKKNNILLASKISGFSDPILQMLTSQMESFSFYDDNYTLLFTPFVNPLSDKTFSYYFFWIEDTSYVGKDTLFTISFKPLKNKDFRGVTGKMGIRSDGWAIENVILSPIFNLEAISMVMEQHYIKIDGKYWFPEYTKTKLNLLSYVNAMPLTSYSMTRNKEIKIDIPLKNGQFISDALLMDSPEAYQKKSDTVLAQYRDERITPKEEQTYFFWDTLTKDVDVDKWIFILKTLVSGEIPYKWIDFKIDKILKLNGQEIVRPGIGVETNDRLSEYFRIGAYLGFGIKDLQFKWGLNGRVVLNKRRKLHITLRAYHDVFKAGSNVSERFDEPYRFSLAKANKIILISKGLLQHYDYVKHGELGISSLLNRWLEGKIKFSYTQHVTAYDYQCSLFAPQTDKPLKFNLAELSLYLTIPSNSTIYSFGNFNLGKKTYRPQLDFVYTRGIKGLLGSDFAYNRFDLKVSQSLLIKPIGNFTYHFQAGFVDKDLPYSLLYGQHGAWILVDVFDAYSFATMRINEFLSDVYLSLQLSQAFPAIYKIKYSSPKPQLFLRGAWGDLRHPDIHQGSNITFQRMNKGYFEGGIALHDVIKNTLGGLGLGVFYRFGHYMLPDIIDNFSFRLSLNIIGLTNY